MQSLLDQAKSWLALGVTSCVLGFIGLLLFFLPILGIPISLSGLAIGLIALVLAFFGPFSSMRWSLAGIAVSLLALGVNLAIDAAPAGYLPTRKVPKSWQTPPERPYVPPPARPGASRRRPRMFWECRLRKPDGTRGFSDVRARFRFKPGRYSFSGCSS